MGSGRWSSCSDARMAAPYGSGSDATQPEWPYTRTAKDVPTQLLADYSHPQSTELPQTRLSMLKPACDIFAACSSQLATVHSHVGAVAAMDLLPHAGRRPSPQRERGESRSPLAKRAPSALPDPVAAVCIHDSPPVVPATPSLLVRHPSRDSFQDFFGIADPHARQSLTGH